MTVSGTYLFSTSRLAVLLLASVALCRPPQVTSKIDSTTLIGLLEQLGTMERALCDESVIVFLAEIAGSTEGLRNDTDSLELRAAVADGFLVDGKGLGEELVRYFFEAALVCYTTAGDEEAERKVGNAWSGHACVEGRHKRVTEFEQCR